MKRSNFKKLLFCLMAIFVCSIGTVCATPAVGIPAAPDISFSDIAGGVTMAMAAVAIPAYKLENLKCVTQDVFKDLQAKFGKLYVLDITLDADESYQFLVRRPTRQHLELIEANKKDVTKANDVIIKNLVVAGNENNVLDDGIVFAQFNAQIAKIVGQGQSFLSKA
ncbi:MAG: hypothetical protein LBN27_05905 [Prevotellaceae bacterium]|jgi:hypothetical protein|nr:hypothetical protein [Prevotellaceae bacterium]